MLKNLKDKYCSIDFEFNQTSEPQLNLVSCALSYKNYNERYWLHHDLDEQEELAEALLDIHSEGGIFLCWQAAAEARSFMAVDPSWYVPDFKWVDLFLEYRQLLNWNAKLLAGKHLIKGKPKTLKAPKNKWDLSEGEVNGPKPEESLAAAVFRLLKIQIDTEHKNEMRDLIISDPDTFSSKDKQAILDYNMSDIKYLIPLMESIDDEYKKVLPGKDYKLLPERALYRGDCSARAAIMEETGYPLLEKEARSFAAAVPSILSEVQRDINRQFKGEQPIFRFKPREDKFGWNQKYTKELIRELYPNKLRSWLKTDSGDLSLKIEAFSRQFSFQHSYPEGNFAAQMMRYLKLKQSLNGFTPAPKGKRNIFDHMGSDGRVRPYLNLMKAQSTRFQPAASGFMFLKPAWMRSLVQPPPGRACGGIDWGSQEFLIGALLSKDPNMIAAYHSGDPYLWFAKAAKAVPKNATKESHAEMRGLFKATTLAEMYMMGTKALAAKISLDTGKPFSEDQARNLDYMFESVFSVFCRYRQEVIDKYWAQKYLRLRDGSFMFGDNPNEKSVANCEIQGTGAAILRRGIALAQDSDLDIIFPLHDAKYQEFDSHNLEAMDVLASCMDSAFKSFFPEHSDSDKTCRLDADIWSPDYPEEISYVKTPGGLTCKRQQIYIDGRAIEEFNRFSKYFYLSDELELL